MPAWTQRHKCWSNSRNQARLPMSGIARETPIKQVTYAVDLRVCPDMGDQYLDLTHQRKQAR